MEQRVCGLLSRQPSRLSFSIQNKSITDGSKVISSCADGIVRIWPLISQDQIVQFDAHRDGAPKFAVNRSCDLVACAYEDGVVRLWKRDAPGGLYRDSLDTQSQ